MEQGVAGGPAHGKKRTIRSMMELTISNADLKAEDVPASADDRAALAAFALTFDGYAHWGERCGERAGAVEARYRQRAELPGALSDLRACVFYEQQRWRWDPGEPAPGALAYMQALLDAIRDRVTGPAP